jgi:hypothetical protein
LHGHELTAEKQRNTRMVPRQLFPQGGDGGKEVYAAFGKLNLFHFILTGERVSRKERHERKEYKWKIIFTKEE